MGVFTTAAGAWLRVNPAQQAGLFLLFSAFKCDIIEQLNVNTRLVKSTPRCSPVFV